MSIKDHIVPTLHNAIGGIITTLILAGGTALVALVQPIREAVMFAALFLIPVWSVVLVCIVLAFTLIARIRRLRKTLSAAEQELSELKLRLTEAEAQMTEAQKQMAAAKTKQQARNAEQMRRDSIQRSQRGGFVNGWKDRLRP